jgi:hypothetical protein
VIGAALRNLMVRCAWQFAPRVRTWRQGEVYGAAANWSGYRGTFTVGGSRRRACSCAAGKEPEARRTAFDSPMHQLFGRDFEPVLGEEVFAGLAAAE